MKYDLICIKQIIGKIKTGQEIKAGFFIKKRDFISAYRTGSLQPFIYIFMIFQELIEQAKAAILFCKYGLVHDRLHYCN